jgi:hypothetical protein
VATDGLAPLALSFAPQQVYTSSAPQTVTLTNTGDNALTLIAIQVSGGNFTATNGCGVALSGHSSCTISVVSSPAVVGATSGVLTVSDQFRVQTVTLSGSGLAPPGVSLSPGAGLNFPPTGVTTTSSAQTVTLSNEGGSPLALGGITVTGDFSVPAASNTCGSSVAAGAACTFQVVFTPTAAGPRTGSLQVADDAAGSPEAIPLEGVGVDFTLNANGASSVTVASGVSAAYPLLLTSAADIPGSATLACTGAPANATCLVVPSSVPLGGTTTITATVETGVSASAASSVPTDAARRSRGAWWVIALPLALAFPNRRRLRRPLSALLPIALLLGAAGCGAGRIIPGSGGSGPTAPVTPTPSGSYPITVSATSAGLTRSVTLTLVVQ